MKRSSENITHREDQKLNSSNMLRCLNIAGNMTFYSLSWSNPYFDLLKEISGKVKILNYFMCKIALLKVRNSMVT